MSPRLVTLLLAVALALLPVDAGRAAPLNAPLGTAFTY